MAELPFGLNAEDFRRLSSSVRKSEGLPPRRDLQLCRPKGGEGAPHNWLKVTSATAQTINLTGGGTVQGYPAVWSYFDSTASGWIDTTNNVWFIGANGETPAANTRYECRCLGADVNNQTIWGTELTTGSNVSLLYPTSDVTLQVQGGQTGQYVVQPAALVPSASSAWLVNINGIMYMGDLMPFSSLYLYLAMKIDEDANGIPIYYPCYVPEVYGIQLPPFSATTSTTLSPTYANSYCAAFGLNSKITPTTPIISGPGFYLFGGADTLVSPGPTSQLFGGGPGAGGGIAPGPYLGATGMNGNGDMFLNGWCIVVGAGSSCGGGIGTASAGAGINVNDNAPIPGLTTFSTNSNNGTIDGGTWV